MNLHSRRGFASNALRAVPDSLGWQRGKPLGGATDATPGVTESPVNVLCDLPRGDELDQHPTNRSILCVAPDGARDVRPAT